MAQKLNGAHAFMQALIQEGVETIFGYPDGDIIEIDIPNRTINARVSDEEFAERRKAEEARGKDAFTAAGRDRKISNIYNNFSINRTSNYLFIISI